MSISNIKLLLQNVAFNIRSRNEINMVPYESRKNYYYYTWRSYNQGRHKKQSKDIRRNTTNRNSNTENWYHHTGKNDGKIQQWYGSQDQTEGEEEAKQKMAGHL